MVNQALQTTKDDNECENAIHWPYHISTYHTQSDHAPNTVKFSDTAPMLHSTPIHTALPGKHVIAVSAKSTLSNDP